MGWFDEQIKQRKQTDDAMLEEAFAGFADAVLGTGMSSAFASDEAKAKTAIDEILTYYKVKPGEVPDSIKNLNDRLEYLLRPHGIMRRNIRLEKGWYKDAVGAILGTRKDDGSIVAFIPGGFSGYVYFDSSTGKWLRLSKKTEVLFEDEGICFYKPFPLKKLTVPILMKYMADALSPADVILVILAAIGITALGLISPKITGILFGTILNSGNIRLLVGITVFMISVTVSTMLIGSVQSLLMSRLNTKLNLSVQAATMMRILSMPADFFKEYGSGELASRAQNIQSICNMLVSTVLGTGLTSLFSLVYISQIFTYAKELVIPAIAVIVITLVFSIVTTLYQQTYTKKQMELGSEESGMSYALISGIQKIKLSGAEKRAFSRWANLYSKQVQMQYNPPLFLRANGAFGTAISLLGTLVMYYMAVKSSISVADYYAFTTAYAMVTSAFMALTSIASTVASFGPIMDMAKPIMETVPEVSEGKEVLERLGGGIELNNISFRYKDSMPLIIDDLSLKIRPGQYVAIVGPTGCGKSTLMRLMLGFEKPQKGAIYYDGKDISSIDLKSLRRKIGVVMQNGKLFQGDIYSNIVISAPRLSMDEAWQAAEMAGIAEDIRHMPMGMHTIISEGSGGVSGGQRQRIMIARAIAPKPRILMFDEATSALDNITQKIVSDSLDSLKCTRIVIAHRLSTIRQCDRIIYLEKGKIAEEGTYDELIAKNGKFAELVERQRLDS